MELNKTEAINSALVALTLIAITTSAASCEAYRHKTIGEVRIECLKSERPTAECEDLNQ